MPPKPKRPESVTEMLRLRGWRLSRKGNLWRKLEDGTTMTVFKKKYGGFGFCVYCDEEYYSRDTYDTVRDAQLAAWDYVDDLML